MDQHPKWFGTCIHWLKYNLVVISFHRLRGEPFSTCIIPFWTAPTRTHRLRYSMYLARLDFHGLAVYMRWRIACVYIAGSSQQNGLSRLKSNTNFLSPAHYNGPINICRQEYFLDGRLRFLGNSIGLQDPCVYSLSKPNFALSRW